MHKSEVFVKLFFVVRLRQSLKTSKRNATYNTYYNILSRMFNKNVAKKALVV